MNTSAFRLPILIASSLLFAASARATVTETFKQTYPLTANGAILLDNVNGDIEIVAWDKTEVSLEAEKSAKTDEKLKRISLEIDARPDQLSIKTKYAKTKGILSFNTDGSVRYKLMVPAGATLKKIESVNSNITVTNVRGEVDLETVNGRLTATGLAADASLESVNGRLVAEFTSLENVSAVSLESVNGRATLTLPKGANVRLDAETVNGSIKIAQAITLSKSGKREIKGAIGSGGPSIEIETVNGGIVIEEAK